MLEDLSEFNNRPILVVLAGPNGAGKTTFYEAHLRATGLRYLNADFLARELDVDPYRAAEMAGRLRHALLEQRESFIFETVLSDPVGDKLAFLKQAVTKGYSVVICFIALENPLISEERVAMRVQQGGHDVPTSKLISRFPRTLANLKQAICELPCVLIFDNSDLLDPCQLVAVFRNGKNDLHDRRPPNWLHV